MRQYEVRAILQGNQKFFSIYDSETFEMALLPTKYLKYKVKSGLSPETVQHSARSLCYYLNYLAAQNIELEQVTELSYEKQNSHFIHFLYWLKEGNHLIKKREKVTGNGTCNAYLKDVFGFFSYLDTCGYTRPLRVLSYNQITVANAYGVKRTLRSRSFKGYLKAKERNVRAAEESEIIQVLAACTNIRDQLLLLLLGETGFRIGELLGVDYIKDIDYENYTIRVFFRDDNENEARAKNAEYRRSKISEDTYRFLLHYLNEYHRLLQHQSYLFINISGDTAGKPLKVESVYDMLNRMQKKTGIKLTPHMLRRYFARTRWDAGWPLELLSQALGHKHLDTTTRYLGILDDKLMKASQEFYEKHSGIYGVDNFL